MIRLTGTRLNRTAVRSLGALFAVAAMCCLGSASAQEKPATIHGHVNNAAGMAIVKGSVRLTTEHSSDPIKTKWSYTFPIDGNGDYKGDGIVPNTYLLVVVAPDASNTDRSIDYIEDVKIKAGDDLVENFDMTRKAFIDKMTPEEKKALEEYKKLVAANAAGNAKIANLNASLKEAREDNKAGKFDAAVTVMTPATQQAPEQAILWITLGDAQLGIADAAMKQAKIAGQSPTDPALLQKYTDAAASYKKGADANAASKKPSPETAGDAYNQMGLAYGRSGDVKDAIDAFDQAAKAEPAKAATYYYNGAATFFNLNKVDEAAAEADKAIAADPKKADAYFIKGQSLIQKVTVDPKTNKITAPPGCVDAYQMYLQLAPDGAHAKDVRDVLTGIGETVKTNFKAGKK